VSEAFASMSRHRSPFEGHGAGEQLSASRQIGVTLSADTLAGMVLVTTWPAGIGALRQALAAALGKAPPARPGLVVSVDAGALMCTGPEEFLVVASTQADWVGNLRAHIAADVGSVTDLGHARCVIRIEGVQCRDTLSKLFALDLRESALPVGEVRQTGHHHVPCTLHRIGLECFDLLVFSTYAFDQLATLLDAAREYGVSLTLGAAA